MSRSARPLASAVAFGLAGLVMAMPAGADAPATLTATARALAHGLGPTAEYRSLLVVASPVTSDVAAPRGDELAARVGELVAAALGGAARADAHPMSLPAARARAASVGALVYLDVRVDAGELRVTADLHPAVANAWDRLRAPPPPPAAHAYAHAAVTAEVRAYLAPVHLEKAELRRFTHDAGSILAIACGDLDGDGGNDLVLVSDREVVWGYLRQGKFVAARRAPASAIGRLAPVPWREPLATAYTVPAVDGSGTLFVGWSDRVGATTGPDLAPRTHLAGLPVALGGGVACVLPKAAQAGFEDVLVGCEDTRPAPGGTAGGGVPTLVDAWFAADVVGADGESRRVVATREPSGVLRLVRPGASGTIDRASLGDSGAQVAIADLDQDGSPEVVSTRAATAAGEEDALLVSTWGDAGLSTRLRWAAPAGVDAVAVCPPDVDDAPSVVAAVGSEIWLVR